VLRAWTEVSKGTVGVCTCTCKSVRNLLLLFHGHMLRWCCTAVTMLLYRTEISNRFFVAYFRVVSLNIFFPA
jgi:hypothetical protein